VSPKIDVLRKAIAYCREHPNEYDQFDLSYRSANGPLKTCVIGRAAIIEGAVLGNKGYINEFPGGGIEPYDFVVEYLGLDEDDYEYIYKSSRNLDEIEGRVNEIAARESPPVVEHEILTINVRGRKYDVPADHLDWFIVGVRAIDPDVRIVKVTEEVL
jgi:hypothetical protein